jgi:hypothetical protein
MTHYLIEFTNNSLTKEFRTDGEAIEFCEYLIDEYEFGCEMYIMKRVLCEDNLSLGYYWAVVWSSRERE